MDFPGTRYKHDHRHTHADRLERWIGKEACENISLAMRNWYGPPVAIQGVPGAVFAAAGGDFIGEIRAGQEMSCWDRLELSLKRWKRHHHIAGRYSPAQLNAFASISAIVAAVTGGKAQRLVWRKTGVTGNATGNSNELWTAVGTPAAGAAGAAAPGGTATTNGTTGHMGWANPVTANSGHFLRMDSSASVVNTLLVVDQLLRVAKTMNSTATEAVTGTFSRYQSQTATDEDYIGGNFMYPAVPATVLPATAHNWTVCQYTDQGGNTAQSAPSVAGVSACVVGGIDLAVGQGSWFMPLASGDTGVKALTQMQCSALVATGTIDFVVAHPIAFCPHYVINLLAIADGLYTAMQLTRVYDNACLSLIEACKTATTGTNYAGILHIVAE